MKVAKCLFAMMMVCVSLTSLAQIPKSQIKVNFCVVVDSALVLADNYADALVDKPEIAPSRLNVLRNFAANRSSEVCDSICARLYDFFVNYTEQNRTDRATAFKDCYLALVSPDNPQLGPFYAAELAIAREGADTTAVKKYVSLLEEYATRMNFDYDAELADARAWLNDYRNRKPINEALMGVWVGENVCTSHVYIPSLIESFITDIEETKKKYRQIIFENRFLSITYSTVVRGVVGFKDFWRVGYSVPEERKADGKYLKKKSFFFEKIKPNSFWKDEYFKYFPQIVQHNNDFRSVYCAWSNNSLHSFNSNYYAMLRQNLQQRTASLAGELARKNVSYTTKLWGGIVNQSMWQFSNSVYNWLAVSTAQNWLNEMTITLISPKELKVWIHTQSNVVKSNSPNVRTDEDNKDGILYVKWEPQDDVFFIEGRGIVTLGEPTKNQKKRMKEHLKIEKKNWQSQFGKAWSQKKYNQFEEWFNTKMFNKLKSKINN